MDVDAKVIVNHLLYMLNQVNREDCRRWPEPEPTSCPNYVRKEVNPNRTSPANFGLGKHEITYSFWYKVDDKRQTEIKCFINFNVVRK